MHLEIMMPSTIVERPSSVSTMSAAARAASVDPVYLFLSMVVSAIYLSKNGRNLDFDGLAAYKYINSNAMGAMSCYPCLLKITL
jgi:hypothetical protein